MTRSDPGRFPLSALAFVLAAACGGDPEPGAPLAEAGVTTDTAALTVADAPMVALDSARAAAERGDSALPAQAEPGGAAGESRVPPDRPPPSNPITADEARGYRLTMERIRQLARAGDEIARLQAARPEIRDSMAVATPDPNAILERLTSVPAARDAVARAGFTPRDYTLATIALMQAGMMVEMRNRGASPDVPVNEANVALVSENWEEIQRIMREVAQRAGAGARP
jgi:hypothetical protein